MPQSRPRHHPVCIASADKDLLQLLDLSQVRQLRTYNNWDTWRTANVVEKFGVEPTALGDFLALVGDTSDNVKGVPTVGPVTATKLLIAHGDLDGIYRKVDALKVSETEKGPQVETMTPAAQAIATPAIVDKLRRHKADANLARKLVELRTDAPVNFEDIFKERAVVTKKNSGNVNLDSVDDLIVGPTKAASPAPAGRCGAIGIPCRCPVGCRCAKPAFGRVFLCEVHPGRCNWCRGDIGCHGVGPRGQPRRCD